MLIKKILVTGSSGIIGTRLCEKLLEKGYEIVGVDLKANKWKKEINKLTIIKDLRDGLKDLPKDIDLVIHLAANARVYDLILNPNLARDNLEIIFNILEICRKNNIKKFIFSSSREIYGNVEKAIEEEVKIKSCENSYAASKIGGEALVRAYKKCYNIDFIILRLSNVYGMYDEKDRIIPLSIKLIKENKDLTIHGKEKILDFVYIDDAISGILKSIEKFDQVKNTVFNIASGKGVSIVEVAKLIQKYMNSKNKIIIKENRTGEVMKFIADISKAKQGLDYEPKTYIEEGVKKTVEWYEKNIYNKA